MDNNYNNSNFIDEDDLRLSTTNSHPNVNCSAPCNYNNNNDCPMMNINTSGSVTTSSQSYPTTSSDPPHPLPQYIQQIQPVYQQNIENNIQQHTTQPITQNIITCSDVFAGVR
uniref:Uncharacterized protein n=1 Tax=Rhizophagus irregularis (strain DAOM 181602 / DAOM 197198 / MUCL 43194) TaxID=747089 RepID=U9V875_RHIID